MSYAVNQITRGFKVVAITPVKALHAEVIQLEHLQSGARVLHVACPDTENAFSVCIPTPPPNDMGMPHILEHMTLAGSEKYPCKEPFFEMIKRSVATFINALTGNDMTYYPVCSNVHADLFNLAEVYFDAVFHPLLSDQTFQREAHHLAPADPAKPHGDLRIDGVVYSEMKGVFSDPESILEREATRKLLPDTCYGFESGGAPEAIPDLTPEQLREFHATRYHPSNAYIILYGDIPTDDYLAFLEPRLAPYHRIELPAGTPRQKRWTEPKVLRQVYPAAADEPLEGRTYLMLNWLTGDATDPAENARMNVLYLLLLGNSGSPLKKAIIDSRLGANILFDGPNGNGHEASFHIAIDGSEPDRLDAFRKVVFDTLADLAEKPFAKEAIDAAFQQATYTCVEIGTNFPLTAIFRISSAWEAGLNPASGLDGLPYYNDLRKELDADPMVLNRLIREKLLDNPHRLDIILTPDRECAAKTDAKLAERLHVIRKGLTDEQLDAIAETAQKLEEANLRPNTAKDVACLPKLEVSDLDSKPKDFPYAKLANEEGNPLLSVTSIPTNDVVYLLAKFDLTGLPEDLWPFLPRFIGAVEDFGTEGSDFAETAIKRSAVTGSLNASLAYRTAASSPSLFVPVLTIGMKTMMGTLDRALDLFGDALLRIDPKDPERMSDVLKQDRMLIRTDAIQDARSTANIHAARKLNILCHRTNTTSGLDQIAFLDKLAAKPDAAYPVVADAILRIRGFLANSHRVTFAVTAPERAESTVHARVKEWLSEMSKDAIVRTDCAFTPDYSPRIEGLSAPIQVAFSACTIPAPHLSAPSAPFLSIGASLVSSDYLLPELRFKGNAYGAGLTYKRDASLLNFFSFRDPHIAETIETYRRALDFVRKADWSQEVIDNGILTIVKATEAPFRPNETSAIAANRELLGLTDEWRIAWREAVLSATPEKVKKALLDALEEGMPHASVAVVASEEMLHEASKTLGAFPITPVLGE